MGDTKKHWLKPRWLRITLKTLMWIVIAILLLPVLLYIPPIQDLAVSVATRVASNATGMKIGIGEFRLKFPLDIKLGDVYVVEAEGDTMVRAKEAIADVKLLPLLKLDVKLNRLQLNDGYYSMTSSDSTMSIKVRAGELEVDDQSNVDLKRMRIILNKTRIKDGSLDLVMDVYKEKKKEETDTAPTTPIYIAANDLQLENFKFGMSMLPTIDTMAVNLEHVAIREAVVDLSENMVKWKLAKLDGGDFKYLQPTAEWVAAHPAPPSEPSSGAPFRVMGDSISVDRLTALYATKGAKPTAGFDPSYLKFTEVGIGLKDFYNESSTVRLPLTRLTARERSGLHVVSGSGTVKIDSIGLGIDGVKIRTPYTAVNATADVPFALMAMQPEAPMNVDADGRIGLPDVEAFMPALRTYTSKIPHRNPLDFAVKAAGTLQNLTVNKLHVAMNKVVALDAKGHAVNPLDYKKLIADLDLTGSLSDPAVAQSFLAGTDMEIPAFTIKGKATARGLSYGADFALESTAGDVAAKGSVALTPEKYNADIRLNRVNVAQFAPTIGVGHVTGTVRAAGAGFNPLSGHAVTSAYVDLDAIEYKGRELRAIPITLTLDREGVLGLNVKSANPGLDLDVEGNGMIKRDDYTFDIAARIRDLDLQALGLSDSLCNGSGDIRLRGTASPEQWLYDVDLAVTQLDWNLPDQYIHLPAGVTAKVLANPIQTTLNVNSLLTTIDFKSDSGLKRIVDSFSDVSTMIARQLERKSIAIDSIGDVLPPFTLDVAASGSGLMGQLLQPRGMGLDTLTVALRNDSIITGRIEALDFRSPSIDLDSLTVGLKERGELLDYRVHLGNRPGTLDEFAQVNLNGYIGNNRLSAYLTQKNIKGETGYRFGMTAALVDSTASVHFTPLKATIAYMPWTFNSDNYLDCNLVTKRLQANLEARSAESSILAKTQTGKNGNDELLLNISNLHVEDFLQMWVLAPPITASVNTDLHISYDQRRFTGEGTIGVHDFTYEKLRVGDFDLDLDAGYGLAGTTDVNAGLRVNGERAMTLYANLKQGAAGFEPDSIGLSLTRFPLKIANPFLGNNVTLAGYLNGDMRMDGKFTAPILNGNLAFESVVVGIPMMDAKLRLEHSPVTVRDNIVTFEDFNVYGANSNPLTLAGTVNAKKFSDLIFDLKLNANNFELINSDKLSRASLYGKIDLTLGATVRGPMRMLDINGNVNVLGSTDATYRMDLSTTELQSQQEQDVVRFVNFNDSTQVVDNDSVVESPLNMRITATAVISPGTQIQVLLSENGTDKVIAQPTANLRYFQNYMGDMTLNGSVTTGAGFVRYAFPIIGEKMFTFDPASTIRWNGEIMNPVLDVTAYDEMKTNVTSGSNSRLVNFLITLHATNTLNDLKASFDLSALDDLTIQNELQTMSPDQRQTQAMNMLLYGQYAAAGTKAKAADGNFLYSMLESQLNSFAAKYVRGVDLSFGINQYDKMSDGAKTTETSYSYQVSKSLFNNKFKILVGGNYSTDANADENLANNLVSDVSLEYIIKQTQTTNMNIRLFRHVGFENILEGEVSEMGVGFVMKRKLDSLKSLFRFGRRKKKNSTATADSVKAATEVPDSLREIVNSIKKNEDE